MRKNIFLHISILFCVAFIFVLSSCARFPETVSPSTRPDRTLYVSATMLGSIVPQYRYYLAIGIDQQDLSGPVPVTTGGTTGWGTLSNSSPAALPPYFVYYTGGSTVPGIAYLFINGVNEGAPYYFTQSRVNGTNNYKIEFEVDLEQIEDLITHLPDYSPSQEMRIQINFITRENETAYCQYDSFGVTPHQTPSYISIPLRGDYSEYYGNSDGGSNVHNFEVQYSYSAGLYGKENTAALDGIDMIEWRIETRKYNN